MRDQLLDIVEHTHKLGDIELVKVIGDTNETIVNAVNEGRSVVVNAKFNDPLPDFIGTFGMPELGKLNTILRISEYAEDAKISINKKDDGEPSGIHFENKTGDFKNDFRFMSSVVVNEKLAREKTVEILCSALESDDTSSEVAPVQYVQCPSQAGIV